MEPIAKFIKGRETTETTSPATWIRSFIWLSTTHARDTGSKQTQNDLIHILLHACRLQHLCLPEHAPTVAISVPLLINASDLYSLQLTVTPDSLHVAGRIGQLSRLQVLSLTSKARWTSVPPWELPVLRRLKWKSAVLDGGLQFLLQSRFDKVMEMSLIIHNMGGTDSDSMVSLIKKHPQLRKIAVYLDQAHFTKVLPQIKVPVLSLEDTELSGQLIHKLSPDVQRLTVAVDEDGGDLWALLSGNPWNGSQRNTP
jgi:hypothetical protein